MNEFLQIILIIRIQNCAQISLSGYCGSESVIGVNGTKYSRMDQVKFVEDSL